MIAVKIVKTTAALVTIEAIGQKSGEARPEFNRATQVGMTICHANPFMNS